MSDGATSNNLYCVVAPGKPAGSPKSEPTVGVLTDLSEEDFVLGVRREKLSKKPCVIVNCFEDVQETMLHGGLTGRMASKKMPGLKAHIYLGWQTLPAGVELPGHWHDIEEIWVILDGEATWIDCDGSQRKIRRGDFIHVTPNGYHGVRNSGQKPLQYILIKSPIPQQLAPHTAEFFEPIERHTAKAKPLTEISKMKNPHQGRRGRALLSGNRAQPPPTS